MQNRHLLVAGIIALSIIFFLISAAVHHPRYVLLEKQFAVWLSNLADANALFVASLFSFLGSVEFIAVFSSIVLVTLIAKRDYKNGIFFLLLSAGGIMLNLFLKLSFQRGRPGETEHLEFFNISLEFLSYSFPSGHVMRATLLFVFLAFLAAQYSKAGSVKKLVYFGTFLLIFGVSASRVLLEAHYLGDVLAAFSMSMAWFLLFLYLSPLFNGSFRKGKNLPRNKC